MKVYAKCNLSLNNLGLRPDGYHELDMVVCSVSLCDEVKLTLRADSQILCVMDGRPQEKNSALTAARLFQSVSGCPGMDIFIKKGIPPCAGLGGSSADAAAVLVLLDRLLPGRADIRALAAQTGSDTCYMLEGGFARMRGRGERVRRFSCGLPLWFLFGFGRGVSTKECFSLAEAESPSDNGRLIAALERGDGRTAAEECGNALISASSRLDESIPGLFAELGRLGAPAVNMTGSGSGVYALFFSREEAEGALGQLGSSRSSFRLLESLPHGMED